MSTTARPSRPSRTRRTRIASVAAAATLSATVLGAVAGASPAQAINPAQTQYSGVVNYLGGPGVSGSIAAFWSTTMSAWGRRYVKPTLYYYNSSTVGDYSTPCGNTAALRDNSFYCSTGGNNSIYLDYTWNQKMTTQYGDFGSGGILAHEWGHAAQYWLGYGYTGYRSEYHADCLAGMYARWGYASGRLVGSDYTEMFTWLYNQPQSASHGYGPTRADWYRWGYTQYSLGSCNQVFGKAANASPEPTVSGPTVGASAGAPTRRGLTAGADERPITPSIVGLTGHVRTPSLTASSMALAGVATPDGHQLP